MNATSRIRRVRQLVRYCEKKLATVRANTSSPVKLREYEGLLESVREMLLDEERRGAVAQLAEHTIRNRERVSSTLTRTFRLIPPKSLP